MPLHTAGRSPKEASMTRRPTPRGPATPTKDERSILADAQANLAAATGSARWPARLIARMMRTQAHTLHFRLPQPADKTGSRLRHVLEDAGSLLPAQSSASQTLRALIQDGLTPVAVTVSLTPSSPTMCRVTIRAAALAGLLQVRAPERVTHRLARALNHPWPKNQNPPS